MSQPSNVVGSPTGPVLPIELTPYQAAPPPSRLFTLRNPGASLNTPALLQAVFDVPYIASAAGVGAQVAVWHLLAGVWVLNTGLGPAGIVTLVDDGVTSLGGGGGGSSWIYNVPSFVQLTNSGGLKWFACGMLGNLN